MACGTWLVFHPTIVEHTRDLALSSHQGHHLDCLHTSLDIIIWCVHFVSAFYLLDKLDYFFFCSSCIESQSLASLAILLGLWVVSYVPHVKFCGISSAACDASAHAQRGELASTPFNPTVECQTARKLTDDDLGNWQVASALQLWKQYPLGERRKLYPTFQIERSRHLCCWSLQSMAVSHPQE